MADENFFSRWSRRKADSAQGKQVGPAPVVQQPASIPVQSDPAASQRPAEQPVAATKPALTLEDVAKLTPDSDYSAFVARGVDEVVRRSALKKLFSDPHFNVMDGLDIYIDDYTKSVPIPPEMLARLDHAKSVLNPLSQLEKPPLSMADNSSEHGQVHAETEQDLAATENPQVTDAATSETETSELAAEDAEQTAAPAPHEDTGSGKTDDPTDFSEARS
jgi:hypothetical protein